MKKILVIVMLFVATDLSAMNDGSQMGLEGEVDLAASSMGKLSKGQRRRARNKEAKARASSASSLMSSAETPSDAGSVSSSRLSNIERGEEKSSSWLKGALQSWSARIRGVDARGDIDDATCLDALFACGTCCQSAARFCGNCTLGTLVIILGGIALFRSTPNVTLTLFPNATFDFSQMSNGQGTAFNFSVPLTLNGPWVEGNNVSSVWPGFNVSWVQNMGLQTPGGGGGFPFPRPEGRPAMNSAQAMNLVGLVRDGVIPAESVPSQVWDAVLNSGSAYTDKTIE